MESLEKKIQIAVDLYKSRKLLRAENVVRKLISQHSKIAFLYNLLGLIITENKKYDEAISLYQEGINIQPDNAIIYSNIGMIYKLKNENIKAESYYKKSIELDKNLIEPKNNLGNLYLDLNKHDEAIVCFKDSIKIKSNSFISYYNLGVTYMGTGEFKKAKDHLQKSIQLYPFFYKAHRALSRILKYTKEDSHFKILKKIYVKKNINSIDKTEIAFALGKAYEDTSNFSKAYECYNEGNKLKDKKANFSFKKENNEFNLIKNFFNNTSLNKNKTTSLKNSVPIFILGMPRSGTTLVEQIISSHQKVYAGSELIYFNNLIKKNFYTNNILSKEKLMKNNEEIFNKIGSEYISEIKKITSNEKITDKLPINFKWIGFIKLIFPESKVIHCVRNSKDTCLSIFKNYFTNTDLNYAYNLKNLVNFYNLYIDLMKFWKSLLPGFIIDIDYEKLTERPEKEISNLIKSCDLKWDEKCLSFYKNNRPINTASDVQVRKKIYTSSINSWKNYEIYLKKRFSKLVI